jgi:hypothetical protein
VTTSRAKQTRKRLLKLAPLAHAFTPKVCALLRRRPDTTTFFTSADKLYTFVTTWIACLDRRHDGSGGGGSGSGSDLQHGSSAAEFGTGKTAWDGLDLSLESIYFRVIGKRLEVKGSKCPKADCGNPKMQVVSVTMRAGDEGMATIYLCAECGTLVKKIKT